MATQETAQQIIHQPTLFAEPIFKIGNFIVTNSLLSSSLAVFLLVWFFYLVGKKINTIPGKLQNFFEIILDGALGFADSITGDRKKSEKFLPVVLTLFFFILTNNWLGILPFVGTFGFVETHEGLSLFVPFFRGGTADLNTNLALALFAVFFTHFVGVMSVGMWTHFNKFFNIAGILSIPRQMKKDKMAILVSPIKAFVGLIEVVGEVAKTASLSLRLFGNIFAGEVLLASMISISAFLVPLPFIFLEILVGLVQASVFSILTLVFMTMNSESHEH